MDLIGKDNKSELRKFLNNNKFNKILVISGKNSFYKSGASNMFKNLFINKKVNFFVPNQITQWRVESFFTKEPEIFKLSYAE